MNVSELVQSAGWKNFMAKLYGWGASVVIVGALFKINHWPGGGLVITLGLVTEAVIFFFSAFEPPFTEPDWSLVYPELAGMYHGVKGADVKDRKTPTQRLDDMLEKAKLDQKTVDRLGEGMKQLSDVPVGTYQFLCKAKSPRKLKEWPQFQPGSEQQEKA